MKTTLFPLLALVMTAVAPSWLQGQTAAGETPQRTFRVMSIVGRYEGLFYSAGSPGNPSSIVIGPFLSPHLPIPADSQLEVFRLLPPPPDAPAGTGPARRVVFKTKLPSVGQECIVVVRPLVPKDQDTLFDARVIVVPDTFHAGNCLLVNFSSYPEVAYSVKEQIYTLAPGDVRLVPVGEGITSLKVAVKSGQSWALAGSDSWRVSAKHRGYALVFPYIEDPDSPPIPLPPPAWARVNFENPPQAGIARLASP